MSRNILVTGVPKSGKSTLVERALNDLDLSKRGFVTREVRENDQRIGFEVVTSEGQKRMLADVYIDSPIIVSRYRVDVDGFEKILPPLFQYGDGLLYLDEIGQMQLYSKRFQKLVKTYLDSPNIFFGTLSQIYSHPLIDDIRNRNDVVLLEITSENRDEIYTKTRALLLER